MLCIEPHLNNVFDRLAAGTLTPILVMGAATPEIENEVASYQAILPNTTIVRESRAFTASMRELEGQQTYSNDLFILIGKHGLATEAFLQMRLEGYKRGSVVLVTDAAKTIVEDSSSKFRQFQGQAGKNPDGRILYSTISEVAAMIAGTAQKGPKPMLPFCRLYHR